MTHYVITVGDTTLTTSGWSEEDAIEAFYEKAGLTWDSTDDLVADSIRPATVRGIS